MRQLVRFRPAAYCHLCFGLTLALSVCLALQAQSAADTAAPAEEAPAGAVLRTYVNLVQVPVLVLRSNRQPMPPVASARFRVSLDSGPLFAPRHVRREGNDPMRILVLIDESSISKDTLDGVADGIARLDATVLMPQDRVSLAASSGCMMATSATFAPGADLKAAAAVVIRQARAVHMSAAKQKNCGSRPHLWDSMASALMRLKDDPGRKVLIVFTDGSDEESRHTPLQVREMATVFGVSVFAVRRDEPGPLAYVNATTSGQLPHYAYRSEDDPLVMVTESNGGMVLEGRRTSTGEEVVQLIATVRDRYIVDFTRPTAIAGGKHSIVVSIGDRHAFVRVGGTSVPLPDEKETNDPDRVPADHAGEPPVGTRRILK